MCVDVCIFLWVHNVIMSGLFLPIFAKQLKPCHQSAAYPPPPLQTMSPRQPLKPSHLLTPPSTILTSWLPEYWRHTQGPQSSHLCCLQWLVLAQGSSPLASSQWESKDSPSVFVLFSKLEGIWFESALVHKRHMLNTQKKNITMLISSVSSLNHYESVCTL